MRKNTKFLTSLMALFVVFCSAIAIPSAHAVEDAVQKGPLNFIIEEEEKEGLNYRKIFEQLPEDIQDDLAAEAEGQYNQCVSNGSFSKYYDCRCIAIKFLDKRIEVGPERASQNIIRDVTLECPYKAGIAGISYNKCISMFAMDVVGDLEKFCTCFANSVAKRFADAPSLHSQYLPFLQESAMGECGYAEEMQKYRRLERERDIYR